MANVDVKLREVDTICHDIQILVDCEERQERTMAEPPSIFMVPNVLRDISPRSFNPRVVSIGPLHREDEDVQGFEGQKATYVHNLLCRLESPPDQTLKACVQMVHASIDRIRACYAGKIIYPDIELAKLMVMDGCFILEILFRLTEDHHSISGNLLVSQCIFLDLLMLENQIPFFVLQDIFKCTISNLYPTSSLTEIFRIILEEFNPFGKNLMNDDDGKYVHILGFLQKINLPADPLPSIKFSSIPSSHSAVELDRAGVDFKPNQDGKWPLAMEFKSPRLACFCCSWGKPTLRMPAMRIDDDTELILRNLIAYEVLSPQVNNYVTSYALAIDLLVDTPNDIGKLVESKVLDNNLGSNEEAANMINSICKYVFNSEFSYFECWKELDEYYNRYWPKNIARLRRTYFSSPWAFIALVGAIVLFVLTVVQTIFTIKAA